MKVAKKYDITSASDIRKLSKELTSGIPKEIRVPLDGSETAAVAAVKKQWKSAGFEPSDSEVRKMVREARK